MKSIINGKRYNTETAEKIGSTSSSHAYGDMRWWKSSLYKTKKGEFFIHSEGGALSPFSKPYGNGRGGGSTIVPILIEDALQWAQENLDTFEVEQEFGYLLEDA